MVGEAGAQPMPATIIAAVAAPRRTAASSVWPEASPAISPPMKPSPDPMGLRAANRKDAGRKAVVGGMRGAARRPALVDGEKRAPLRQVAASAAPRPSSPASRPNSVSLPTTTSAARAAARQTSAPRPRWPRTAAGQSTSSTTTAPAAAPPPWPPPPPRARVARQRRARDDQRRNLREIHRRHIRRRQRQIRRAVAVKHRLRILGPRLDHGSEARVPSPTARTCPVSTP